MVLRINQKIEGLLQLCRNKKDLIELDEMIDSFPGLNERGIKQLKYFAKSKLKGIQDLANTLKDAGETEVDSAISGLWFEFRSEWIRHNAINNYNMVMHGDADSLSVLQSAYLSFLIGEIEILISEEQLDKMKEVMVSIQYNS
ncbi:hypothetical protein [Leptospira sp. GIMC2001]|uniref:hypothetical protein n=1 Tax=Leptospira sp. GIMC2001 TaxID=1513297 RepID=UPI00234BAF44|nr:hypothetical protein [Leptospira sp. GIMC2001]WCL50095.1 hypothetical protein O4O04_04560 [Leptospira sp. GIMC2001]